MENNKKQNKRHHIRFGLIASLTGVVALFVTTVIVVLHIIMSMIAAETGDTASLFGEWYQVLLFVVDIFLILIIIASLVLLVLQKIRNNKLPKEEAPTKLKLLRKISKFVLPRTLFETSTFFTLLLFVFLIVGAGIVYENEANLNYALGIKTSYTIEVEDDGSEDPAEDFDSEYYKSDFTKADGTYDDAALRKHSRQISREAAADGAVLLWNKNNALPMTGSKKNISIFGIQSRVVENDPDNRSYAYVGYGSGRVDITGDPEFKDFATVFQSEGKFSVNQTVANTYRNASNDYGIVMQSQTYHPDANTTDTQFTTDYHYREVRIAEYPWANVNSACSSTFSQYGDAAIYVISRVGGEDCDVWFNTSNNYSSYGFEDNDYLNLTKEERNTLSALNNLRKNGTFKRLIVLLNTGNAFNMSFASKYDSIDSCLWVGVGGSSSITAIYDVITGKVNPSAKLPDTWAYSSKSEPSYVNLGAYTFTQYSSDLPDELRTTGGYSYNHSYLVYQEGIYVGYRYYETRYEDAILSQGNATSAAGVVKSSNSKWNYNSEVAYPFGYGLSYTTFSYSNFEVEQVEDTYNVKVRVTNDGQVAGKHVVQAYLQKPFTQYDKDNNIEKASIELVGFDKTKLLNPGEYEDIVIPVSQNEFKTYDSYNKKTYILEAGNYYLSIGTDAHDALNNVLAKKGASGLKDSAGNNTSGQAGLVSVVNIAADDYVKYSVGPTGNPVTNQFDTADINLYEGTKDQKITYLSRKDWNSTYPKTHVKMKCLDKTFVNDMQFGQAVVEEAGIKMPKFGQPGTLNLADMINLDYDDPKWEQLLNQLTLDEIIKLCGVGSHVINQCMSVGAPEIIAHDGPAGVKNDKTSTGYFFCFPSGITLAATFDVELVEKVFEAFGLEMMHAGVGEIYGTCAGAHRSSYGGRNWESFSEDAFLAGEIMAAEVIGIQSKGGIVNIKHYALNDTEIYRCGGTVWANEQSIREIYLKSFEIGVVKGDAHGLMSSLNRIGPTWAGRHKGLLTEVLRNEWGFEGFVETDAATANHMRVGESRANAICAGNDLWLRGSTNTSELWGSTKTSPTVCHYLRQGAKHILFAVSRSFGMNGLAPSEFAAKTITVYKSPWYYTTLHQAQLATYITLIILGSLTLLSIGLHYSIVIFDKLNKKRVTEVVEKTKPVTPKPTRTPPSKDAGKAQKSSKTPTKSSKKEAK